MLFLQKFAMPTRQDEERYFCSFKETCYTNFYPFGVFRYRNLPTLEFDPITILYGGNGSGKSTILNVIADKLWLGRNTPCNRSSFFGDYIGLCKYETVPGKNVPRSGRIITSDDVFDYLLNIRCLNEGIDFQREELINDYGMYRKTKRNLQSLDDYDEWIKYADAKTKHPNVSKFVKEHSVRNITERSNGESALAYFMNLIKENSLYLLDEPENSLSAALQIKLKQFIEESARFFKCQFIISTHSPFLLSIPGAKIYDLDADPPCVREWTELENVQVYRNFFKRHDHSFT